MSRKPTQNIDYTSKDYEAFRNLMIEKLQKVMPEYTDISETDAGIVIIEALANGLDILSLYADVVANDVLLPTTQDRSLAVLLANCLGYKPYNQTASEYPQVFVLENIKNTDTTVPKGTVVKTPESSDLATLYFETLEDLVIPSGKLGNEKDSNGNYLYTTTVQNGKSVYQDVIGSSTGAPIQSFKLNYTQVLVDTIELYVNEGQGQKLWKQVDSFLESDEESRVYMVSVDDFDVCTITFGNGVKGKIPVSYPNGIIANYRIGGGEASNVSENTITAMDSSINGVKSTFNLKATILGHDKEGIDSIKENAPASFRTRDRLVTLEDYEDLLRLNFYQFLRLKALRDTTDKKLVHLYYMMRKDYTLDSDLIKGVTDFISVRSMVGTTYDLNSYTAQEVDITANLYVDSDYDKDAIKTDVETYLKEVTFAYGELQFGDTIVKSDLENEIKDTFKGILSFRISSPSDDIINPTKEQNVLTLGNVTINASYL